MAETATDRLARMGVTLPQASTPAANYVPFVRHGDLLFISGQLPLENGRLVYAGKLGTAVTLADGQKAARLCAINVLAQAAAALDGDLERIERIIRLTGFVASEPEFVEQHLVVNGASDFLVEALGDRGRHARAAVGMASLPRNAAV
ncbi:MAG TPA: RidA family protein, partial [Afifellaceae bacterium]|nr:RidA family protein [Afifellaceae bacterium]